MASDSEIVRGSLACEIVEGSKEVARMANLFHLAGTMTNQEVELCITRNPAIAGAATYAESSVSYPSRIVGSLQILMGEMRMRHPNDKWADESLEDLTLVAMNDPYTEAGRALVSTINGATAIFVNVEDPAAFRRELEVFKDLATP